jgi:hypothetical protein
VKSIFPVKWSSALLLILFFSVATSSAQIADELREEGVTYVEGNLPDDQKIAGTLQTATTVYSHHDFQTAIAALYSGQKIEIIGLSAQGYLLKTIYRNNTLTGWIHPEDLPAGIDASLFAIVKKNQAHNDAVKIAITNKAVIQGMTPDEVKQSVGRPVQITSHTDAKGSTVTWMYTTFREEPQITYYLDAYNRPVQTTDYVKIPIGQLIVDFTNGVVTAVTEHKTDPYNPGVVTN